MNKAKDKEFWINLPVKDVKKSREFFAKLGFLHNPGMSDGDNFVCILVGTKKVPMMLFREEMFAESAKNPITDTKKSTEVSMAFDADSSDEVDKIAAKVKKAGGTIYSEPHELQGWMYVCGFVDLDGHRWNVLYRN